nr:MAG TPA: hypothetical protein [Bacteriophage sp.]
MYLSYIPFIGIITFIFFPKELTGKMLALTIKPLLLLLIISFNPNFAIYLDTLLSKVKKILSILAE